MLFGQARPRVSSLEASEGQHTRRSGSRFSESAWARQDCPPALRGLDPPGALPASGNYRSDDVHFRQRGLAMDLNLETLRAPRSFLAFDPGAVSAWITADRSAS